MSEEVKLQESIKKTQDMLGKYIKKPPLTEKLLKKPPFRFLHDIISAVVKETGFLKNLFTEEESNSSNIKDKEAKLAYLTKLIDAVKVITGNELPVRPSKIISGQEPIKTNELLQAIGRALDKKISSAEAVEHYKKNLEKKERKAKASEDKKTTKKSSSSEKPSSREIKDDKGKKESRVPSKDRKTRAESTDRKDSRATTRESRKKESKSEPKRKSSEKRSKEAPKVGNPVQERAEETKNDPPSTPAATEDVLKERPVELSPNEEQVVKEPEKEIESKVPEEPKPVPDDEKKPDEPAALPSGALLRPPSARPSSARPAAPRIRTKPDFVINNAALSQMNDVSIIVENFDAKEDDGEEMVVVQAPTIEDTSLISAPDPLDSQLTQEHGYLVAQILETQKELVNEHNVELIPNKVEIEWETGIKKDRDAVVKEIDKLRGTIQSLTRTTNPLGKLLDFLQEDVEIMERELQDWKSQFHDIREQLIIEKNTTKEYLKPLEESLKEVDSTITNQMEKIFQTKANIMKNHQKIQKLLTGR